MMHNTYIAPYPTRLAQSTSHSKQEWASGSVHEACIHQPIQRQQQSTDKYAHIPEQLMQSRHVVQQYRDHGHIS